MKVSEEARWSDIDARTKRAREINQEIQTRLEQGNDRIRVRRTEAQHNLAVGIVRPASIAFEGSVGYYCGGLIDQPTITISGSAGWGLGESMLSGSIEVQRNAGNGCGASMRGGHIVVRGNVAARRATSMKGGVLIVQGDCGYMAGFMMQKGILIVCGNAGSALADSMYEGVVYVGGEIEELGNDAVIEKPGDQDLQFLEDTLRRWDVPANGSFKKVVAGRRLWNFDKEDMQAWKEIL